MVALGASLLYGLLALVGRGVVHKRRTGSTGLNLQHANGVGRVASALMIVAHVLVVVGAVVGALPSTPVTAAGALVFAAGLALIVWAQSTMGDSWRVGVDASETTELVQRGPFRAVRNPIFSGMAVCVAGVALLSSSWLGALGTCVFVVGVELQVRRVEEPYLRTAHGRRFDAYLQRVGRFVPRLGLVTSTPR